MSTSEFRDFTRAVKNMSVSAAITRIKAELDKIGKGRGKLPHEKYADRRAQRRAKRLKALMLEILQRNNQ